MFAPAVDAWMSGPRPRQRRGVPGARPSTTGRPPSRAVKALSVLDAGCGQGTQAVELARLAHHVVDVDLAETLLDAAGSAATDEPGEVRQRLNSSWSVIFWPWQPCGLE